MHDPKTISSIIIPIYNSESYLDNCISSVINQTCQDIEIILVNDGSTDSSLAICKRFADKDKRIKIINQENSGPSNAKNTGIAASQGKFLLFVDADDYINENMTEIMLEKLINSESDLVICGYNIYEYIDGKPIIKRVSAEAREYIDTIASSDFFKLYKTPMLNQNWNKAYRSDIIKSNKICFQENLTLGEDLLFNLKVLKHCRRISIIKDILYNFVNINPNSLSKKFREDFFEIQKYIYHNLLIFISEYYKHDTSILVSELENWYLKITINCIHNISRFAQLDFREKHKGIHKIVFDKEISGLCKRVHMDGIKDKTLVFLIRRRLIVFLIVLLKKWV